MKYTLLSALRYSGTTTFEKLLLLRAVISQNMTVRLDEVAVFSHAISTRGDVEGVQRIDPAIGGDTFDMEQTFRLCKLDLQLNAGLAGYKV